MQTRWVFGYGSLLWRPGFEFEERVVARVEGWVRRLWQRSEDHRGVPGAEGLVATLVDQHGGVCDGVAYRVAEGQWDEVITGLDHREKGGYLRQVLVARSLEGAARALDVVAYFADPSGPLFAGPMSDEEIAATVRERTGPSGHNAEYVLRLAEELHAIDVHDEHVFTVANHVMDTEHDDANVVLPKGARPMKKPQRPERPWRR